jgi:hypothetical protein
MAKSKAMEDLVDRPGSLRIGHKAIMNGKHFLAQQALEVFIPLLHRLESGADHLVGAAILPTVNLARDEGVVIGLQFDSLSASGHCITPVQDHIAGGPWPQ